MKNKWWAKLLRLVGIVFMSLTALFTLLGGAGTSCVAFNPTGFGDKFAPIGKFQWLYILFVFVTIAIGIMGVRAVVLLVKGQKTAYRYTLISLLAGSVVGIIHITVSRALRGSSMPVDMVVYTTLMTLVIFLLFRIPGIWQGVNFEKPEEEKKTGKQAAAIALGAVGILSLTIQFLMAPTHTIGGINYADAWHTLLTIIGISILFAGVALGIYTEITVKLSEVPSEALLTGYNLREEVT